MTSSILHSHRAPSPENKLPWQLPPGPGRVFVDSLPGALLLLPLGAEAGPQGGAAALPARWAGQESPWVLAVVTPLVDTQTP